ncbi:hypothetical protein HII13_000472 [Brettanomyces bruxellensis]|nr:hypothetical protein HII13_000472 [Brettanomyces bruxellensis]
MDNGEVYSNTFKPLPLPDDSLGFDAIEPPTVTPAATVRPDITQGLQSSRDSGKSTQDQDDDLESILFDLGIQDAYDSPVNPSSGEQSSETGSVLYEKTHTRKISGSGIFGFVGTGSNTQLAIPGIDINSVPLNNKKPVYNEVMNFDNLNFHRSHPNAQCREGLQSSAKVQRVTRLRRRDSLKHDDDPDYFFTGDASGKYKFPTSSVTLGSTGQVTASYSAQDLKALRPYHDNLEGCHPDNRRTPSAIASSPIRKSPDHSSILSSPTKEVNSVEDIDRILNGKDLKGGSAVAKPKLSHQIPSLAPLSSSSVQSSPGAQAYKSPGMSPVTSSPIRFKSVSPFGKGTKFTTPLKVKNTFSRTPSPQRAPKRLNWIPTLITKRMIYRRRFLKNKLSLQLGRKGQQLDQHWLRVLWTNILLVLIAINYTHAICKKAFVRNHDLRRHYKGHLEYQYVCPCGKKFPRQDALKRHRIRNICVGGIPDDRGVLKRKGKKSKKRENKARIIIQNTITNDFSSAIHNHTKQQMYTNNCGHVWTPAPTNIIPNQLQRQVFPQKAPLNTFRPPELRSQGLSVAGYSNATETNICQHPEFGATNGQCPPYIQENMINSIPNGGNGSNTNNELDMSMEYPFDFDEITNF